jgi:type I restriction enzyme S subunit
VFPSFEKQNKIELENIELASLRDWLLPMLMNGQVSVGDFEEELGMVAEERERYEVKKH